MLFYKCKITLCSEVIADICLKQYITKATDKTNGLDEYMYNIKNNLSEVGKQMFLCRVAIAAMGAKDINCKPTDILPYNCGQAAVNALGIAPTAKAAWERLESLKNVDVEDHILARITYIAFWRWNQNQSHKSLLYLTN